MHDALKKIYSTHFFRPESGDVAMAAGLAVLVGVQTANQIEDRQIPDSLQHQPPPVAVKLHVDPKREAKKSR